MFIFSLCLWKEEVGSGLATAGGHRTLPSSELGRKTGELSCHNRLCLYTKLFCGQI